MVWKKITSKLPSQLMGIEPSVTAHAPFSLPPTASDKEPMTGLLKRLGSAVISKNSVWRQACSEYQRQLKFNTPPPQLEFFVGFGPLHLAVADILLDRMDDIAAHPSQRVVHIAGASGLLAVFSRHERLVQLRVKSATALGQIVQTHELDLRVMPTSARLLEGVAARDFQRIAWEALVWYFGQNALQALTYVPDLQQQILHVNRFPHLEPACLCLRHLRLLHVLSQNSHNFESLLLHQSDEQRVNLCPDLASLYLTGAVTLKAA